MRLPKQDIANEKALKFKVKLEFDIYRMEQEYEHLQARGQTKRKGILY